MSDSTQVRVERLESQYPSDLLGLPGAPIQLNWQVKSNLSAINQTHYRVEVASDSEFLVKVADSGWVESEDQIGVLSPAGQLESRETQYFRVKIRTSGGESDWSPTLTCEAGLLKEEDWIAIAISDNGKFEDASPILRKEIEIAETPIKARLYVTSMGLNNFYVNGERVGDNLLNPGWTAYQKRLLVDTHDVTALLKEGINTLGSELSDGWWRGKLGFLGGSQQYGQDLGLIAQLEVTYSNGKVETFATDSSWKCSTAEIVFSSIYDGTTIDLNMQQPGWKTNNFDASSWRFVEEKTLDLKTLRQRITSPVRKVKTLDMSIDKKEDRYLLRGTQNISGWVKIVVQGTKGQTVTVRHAEVLEPGEILHTKALRSAKATDTYILNDDGIFTLEPDFTFHGFQFAEVVTESTLISAEAVAISSDLNRRGTFWSSHEGLNKLHENVVWSQLDNFVSLPTDCPQRDERMGWTGDAQAFAPTANTLFDTSSFWSSWLIDLALDQFENGDVSAVVPDILKMYPAEDNWIFEGRAGWADAATIVPMSVYESFGDKSVLSRQLDSMRRWTDALIARQNGNKFLPEEFQFGDWCDPDAPIDKPWLAKVAAQYVANSYFVNTLALMTRVEELVGKPEQAIYYRGVAERLKEDLWQQFGKEAVLSAAGCAFALEFDLMPIGERSFVANALANIVRADDGKISTGFLATPLVLGALSKNGYTDLAYKMLLRREFRSWLYAVDKGATTIWERWDAILEDGSINTGGAKSENGEDAEGSMISFNHYAYGAAIDWVYRNVAGLSPILEAPGYKRILISPKPNQEIENAGASIQTPFGEAKIDWALESKDKLHLKLLIPFGSTAVLDLPVGSNSKILINGKENQNTSELGSGDYEILISNPMIY